MNAFSITQGGGIFNLVPGETREIVVNFNPSVTGSYSATLSVVSNDVDETPFPVTLAGEVADTDGDGLANAWEIDNFGDLDEDGDGNFDVDDLTYRQEDDRGSNPSMARPATPVLIFPDDGATDVSLTSELETDAFSDVENDGHDMTRWQITTGGESNDDTQMVLNLQRTTALTLLEVPGSVLAPRIDYYWRANHTDSTGETSGWPRPFMFSTVLINPDDADNNGRPDDQEVNCAQLFEGSEMPANTVCVNSSDSAGEVGKEPSTNVAAIDAFMALAPADIPDNLASVSDVEFMLRLISFKVTTANAGDTIQMIFHFSEPIPANFECWKWDPDNGWYDYPAHIVSASADRRSITMEYRDCDFGDLDGIANGVVIGSSRFWCGSCRWRR